MDVRKQCLKLILSVDALSPSLSGIGRYTWELASGLAQSPNIKEIRFFRNSQWVRDPSSLLTDNNAKVKRRSLRYPKWARNWYWQRACVGQLFHAPNYFLPPYAENGVVTVHDLSVFKFPETHPLERVKQFEKSFNQTLKIAKHIITDSEATRQEVISYFDWPSDKITSIHLGVSPTFKPRPENQLQHTLHAYGLISGTYCLCVATIEPRKRIDSLIAAYSLLPKHLLMLYPLVLVGGKGWNSEGLHELIIKGQNAGWLHYFGFIPETDLPTLYAGARVFVYPSIYEGFGLPPIEAMASGIPIIVSNQSCLPEVTHGVGLMINPDDSVEFSTALEKSLTDENWRFKAKLDGLKIASAYTWQRCINETIAVYQNVMQKN